MKFVDAAVFSMLLTCVSVEATAVPVAYTFSGILTDIRGGGAGIVFGTSFVGTYIHDNLPQSGLLIEPGRQLLLAASSA